jgi:hypothetical protein
MPTLNVWNDKRRPNLNGRTTNTHKGLTWYSGCWNKKAIIYLVTKIKDEN